KCLYRRDRSNMPGSQREVANAEEQGVQVVWLTAPRGFAADDAVSGVMVQKMGLGAPDATGRQSPEVIDGADYREDADRVSQGLGCEQGPGPQVWGVEGLDVTRWGTIRPDFRSHATSPAGVCAVGELGRGASVVVSAIRAGREAAGSVLD